MTKIIQHLDKMEKHNFTQEQIKRADIQVHVWLKRIYGLEHLDFYEDDRGLYHCKYISDPNDFNYDRALDNINLDFVLKSLSMQQGKIYFDDIGQTCTGINEVKSHYLVIKLSGL